MKKIRDFLFWFFLVSLSLFFLGGCYYYLAHFIICYYTEILRVFLAYWLFDLFILMPRRER